MNPVDLTGRTFGHWTVCRKSQRLCGRNILWWCRCTCMAVQEVRGTHLINGKSNQCRICARQIGFAAARARKQELRQHA